MTEIPNYSDIAGCFWAKKSRSKDNMLFWLPLTQHSLDTMNVAGLLWKDWLSDGQKRLIADSLVLAESYDPQDAFITAKNLVEFLGAVHDVGKATPIFQTKEHILDSHDLRNRLLEKLEQAGFADILNLRLANYERPHHAEASEVLLLSFGVEAGIASIVGAHHGETLDKLADEKSYEAAYFQSDLSGDLIKDKWYKSQKWLFDSALKMSGFAAPEELPSISNQQAMVLLNGLLIMADWIASNENYFPLISIEDDGKEINQKERKKNGWSKWFKNSIWKPDSFANYVKLYEDRFNFKDPRPLQIKLAEIIGASENPSIFIVEAPMGEGKTEAALAGAELLAAKTGRSGIFFGLPTQATSDGIFIRIHDWVEQLEKADDESKSLRLLHGKAALNKDFASIARGIDLDGKSGVFVNEWFSGKKTAILDDFVVGTVDHFLLAALKQKHLSLRHIGLSQKVVIIDEVHAYDAYMGEYLYRAVEWMASYKVPVIILSATLPADKRVALIETYAKGRGLKTLRLQAEEGWKTNRAYPLITSLDGNSVKQTHIEMPFAKEIKVIKIENKNPEDDNLDEIYQILQEKLSDGGVAGIIVNTVRRAQEIAKYLSSEFGDETVELFHSAFIATHRIDKEKELMLSIGRGAKRPAKKIIVGTQVLEQSLDIDFDLLLTDLAPMDLLLQRVGRLHRHKNVARPEKLKEPCLYVMGTSDIFNFHEGSACIYGKYLLIKTQHYLPDAIKLPEDISVLVQIVYSEEEHPDFDSEELETVYEKEKVKSDNKISNKKNKAKSFILQRVETRRSKSLHDWLKNPSPAISDERGMAQVRDTEETIEVIAVQKCSDGYSFFGEKDDLKEKIEDLKTAKELATQTLRLPAMLSRFYNIDKTIKDLEDENRLKLKEWQEQPWLKGSLGLIFDEEGNCELNGWNLYYNDKYGLEYEKAVKDERV
ncbi:MAG: CRISPR-associated helicase Cas3' [Candidatus Riflebacteria bacterium]|nr:CRISPR-associated helicase Cas3' [Candidatus Riflebacteria bacterium]